MIKHNPDNERIKRKYLRSLKESKGQNESSIDSVAMAISRYDLYTKHRDFKKFHYEQVIRFKKNLTEQINQKSGEKLSKSTLNTTLRHLKAFFQWLTMQPGYKSRITYTDTEYFNLSEKDTRIATTRRPKPSPTLEQIKYVIELLPSTTDIQKRNQALIAFTLLTGSRDSAIASMKLKHINLEEKSVFQDAREVKTKFSKTFTTYFFPVGNEVEQVVIEWVNYLKNELLWGEDDPLFPKTKMRLDKNKLFKATGLQRQHWNTASTIREIFKNAFALANLPYFNPHSFRKTLTKLGEKSCQSPEEFKAWSQNLGHEQVLTTFTSYGEVEVNRQGELIREMTSSNNSNQTEADKIADAVVSKMQKIKVSQDS